MQSVASRLTVVALCALFFVSGMPALIYQLVWQRALFTLYGINIEAVTIVVTGFMVGLGLGGLFGGGLSRWRPMPLLVIFGVIELGIAGIGFFSLSAIHSIGEATLSLPGSATAAISLLLLLIPTLLMGATLPILSDYLVRIVANVGRSIGLLYFVNTLGSSVACFLVGIWIMRSFGMQGAVGLAAAVNAMIGVAAIVLALLQRDFKSSEREPPIREFRAIPAVLSPSEKLRWRVALALAFATGYLALGYEIIWFRLFSQATGGRAGAFAFMLGAYLFGIAFGSLLGRRLCDGDAAGADRLLPPIAILALLSSILGMVVIPLIGISLAVGLGASATAPILIALHASLSGATFPLIGHYGISPGAQIGSRVSMIYLANILGSACGSLLTGFVLMDRMGLAAVVATLGGGGSLIALGIAALRPGATRRAAWTAAALATIAAIVLSREPLYRSVYERLQFAGNAGDNPPFTHVVENRSGVITVTPDRVVFGSGAYDGRISVDIVDDRNGILRALLYAFYHPSPRDVLVIGMSTGAWAQAVASDARVERIDIVEINPGYVDLAAAYPEVSSLLQNPKVTIHIDDGRRWLAKNRERKYDVILQNTTWNWRSNASNLLSIEYHALVHQNLKPGGLFQLNTTTSQRANRTGCLASPDGELIDSFLTLSNAPLKPDAERLRSTLANLSIDGRRLLDLAVPSHAKRLDEIIRVVTETGGMFPNFGVPPTRCQEVLSRTARLAPITDDNMGEEWESISSGGLLDVVRKRLGW